jgi:hypothetical protein
VSMSKRDYEVIAHALRIADDQAIGPDEIYGVAIARQNIEMMLKNNSPTFDRERFLGVARGEWPCMVCNLAL